MSDGEGSFTHLTHLPANTYDVTWDMDSVEDYVTVDLPLGIVASETTSNYMLEFIIPGTVTTPPPLWYNESNNYYSGLAGETPPIMEFKLEANNTYTVRYNITAITDSTKPWISGTLTPLSSS